MEELFAQELAAAPAQAPIARARIVARAVGDLLRRAPYEHWRRRGRGHYGHKESLVSFFFADLRFALRTFARQPGATALIVVTLTLAIAANTAVFAVVDAVFFRSLPYPNASRLVDLNETAPKWDLEFTSINYPDFVAWRERAHLFESMGLWANETFNAYDGTSPARLEGQQVTYDLARTLGVRPVVGRAFTREEDAPKGPNVVMLGYSLWQSRYAGSRDVVGKTLRLRGEPWTIIGVLPSNVTLDGPSELWVPLRGDPKQQGESYSYEGVGRLKPGVTIDQARKDLYAAHEVVWRASDSSRVVSPRIMPLRDRFVDNFRTLGGALGAGVALVLLIACANTASTMLARSVFRRREMGIRLALGASSGRLTRQFLTESLALAAIAGVFGALIGRAGVHLLTSGIQSTPPWLHLAVDLRAMSFSVSIVLVTTLLFGLVPTLSLRRQKVADAIGGGATRVAGSLPERRMLSALVVVEVALAAILLATGGLLLRAHRNLRNVDPGFRADGVASFRLTLTGDRYRDGLADKRFYDQLIERLRALPGVDAAGIVTCPPFSCHWGSFFTAEGAAKKSTKEIDPVVLLRLASPDYFKTMGIRLVRGRFYAPNEGNPKGPRFAVINEELAKQLWPDGRDPVGKRFIYRGDTSTRDWMTVTGVVHDVRHYGLSRPMIGGLYLSTTAIDSANAFPGFAVVAHTTGDPSTLFAALRGVVHDLDPELPMYAVQTMRVALDHSLASHRALTLWLGLFAAIALTLAVGGIYAMLSYAVGRRRHEIGIRIALGARTGQVLRLIVTQGLRLVAIGVLIGLSASFAAARLLSSQLVGVTAKDPLTYAAAVAALAITGAVASFVPARRAARVDPKIAFTQGT